MKKSILLAALILAVACLAGCDHPADIIDDLASIAAPAALA